MKQLATYRIVLNVIAYDSPRGNHGRLATLGDRIVKQLVMDPDATAQLPEGEIITAIVSKVEKTS